MKKGSIKTKTFSKVVNGVPCEIEETTARFTQLIGQYFTKVTVNKDKDMMDFETADGRIFRFQHYQDCCETVYIEDICGNLDDLANSVILGAEVITQYINDYDDGDLKWTFYKFWTTKGYVTVRWYGSSNGYYSVDVHGGWVDEEEGW